MIISFYECLAPDFSTVICSSSPSSPSRCHEEKMSTGTAADERPSPSTSFNGFKTCLRMVIVGTCFAIPIAGLSTMSPLIRLSLNQDNFKQLAPRVMGDFFCLSFTISAVTYGLTVERRLENPHAQRGFMPYLDPLAALKPALACWIGGHCFYPGMWAIYNERTWRARLRESSRLIIKTLVAFSPIHLPAALLLGIGVGVLMAPFKYLKKKKYWEDIEAAELRQQLEISAQHVLQTDLK